MNKILILGAGLVSRPIVNYLLDKGYLLTVADMNMKKAMHVISNRQNATTACLDVKNDDDLDSLIAEHDLVVSLLPSAMHLLVVKLCIKRKKFMVTTSYQSPEMVELKSLIEESGIIVLNEMGLDPGIDHMSAKRIIDRVHSKGGQVREFISICGALPAPHSVDNPLGYKFTWSPRGVLLASTHSAQYLEKGQEINVPSELLFHNPFKVNIPDIGSLDVYPNRNSLSYIEEYGIPEVSSMMRGTIRMPGWCQSMDAIKQLGLFDTQPLNMEHMSYFNLVERKVGTLYPEYKCQIAKFLQIDENSVAIKSLEWLGYFSNEKIGRAIESPFNVTADLMFNKMQLKDTDEDMVILQHELLVKYEQDGEERIVSTMILTGSPLTDTAISTTVALPAAIAVDLILKNEIKQRGLLRPFMPEIYEPVLQKLEEAGIIMKEEVKNLV